MRSIASLVSLAIIALVAIAWALAPVLALAAAGDTTVSAAPIVGAIEPLISAALDAVIVVAIGWAAGLIHKWTGIQIEARHREALHSAAMTGVTRVLNALGERAENLTYEARSQVAAQAVGWVTESVPDAVRYLGATPDKIGAIVSAKLGQLIADAK
ncbi:hypothetical protein [Ancylobacter sp. G4_0304]|uniref:hypothetical protein n=1 Tax=Ancylobacter sp. G4_0304 TaxID=3114289 RepID=UPI0039C6EE05